MRGLTVEEERELIELINVEGAADDDYEEVEGQTALLLDRLERRRLVATRYVEWVERNSLYFSEEVRVSL